MAAFSTQLIELFPHEVQVSDRSTFDKYGQPSFGSASTYKALWQEASGEVRDTNGNVVESRGTVHLATTASISPEARVTLPDNSTPPILRVERLSDENGVSHVKVHVGFER